jgi:phosphoribosylformylglycinamidine synthase
MSVYRCFTEKKPGFDVEARAALSDLRDNLALTGLGSVRLFNRYDLDGVTERVYADAKSAILSEPPIDDCYDEACPALAGADFVLAVESLPGQYDQRADSCAQCIQLMTRTERPTVRAAKVYAFYGELSGADESRLRAYLINPVESREASPDKPDTLISDYPEPLPTQTLRGFISADASALEKYLAEYGLAMDFSDLSFMQAYFRDEEKRDPTITELRLIDTYWSDHCRHTTFLTSIDSADIADETVKSSYGRYMALREFVYGDNAPSRPVTLMDIATIGAKALKKRGLLKNLDVSDEINACSIQIDVETKGKTEPWLLMFKNETHNHPTEIEPFGGAATCIGGAIRDPLSGRAYVYQAMRVTGASDPRVPMSETLPGKLPQRKLTVTAAQGYSSYGNQIGLATGHVQEYYHPGYVAKRMEIGAVVGAVKSDSVRRETPLSGDVVILLGGRTGRDGIGGATGSSKTHNIGSLESTASEVQKGNAPEERKIQRLFLDPEVTGMIKRCNDFGAGGVSVAIGELADGLEIDLSLVRKKYEGLSATELAISESQERMAVVVSREDTARFIEKAQGENLEAYAVAAVTDDNRLRMRFGGATVADLSRDFLSSNGTQKHTDASVAANNAPETASVSEIDIIARLREIASDLRYCSRRGLVERFDSSVGAGTVLSPFGGKTQRTPAQAMAALIPVQSGTTDTCSVMAHGFDPYLSEQNPDEGALFAVVTSVAKLVAAGCDPSGVYLTFQEYFERLRREPIRWGKPLSALLGALDAQMGLSLAAIGGKDSMSGTFMELDVPPALVSFAISPASAGDIISPEFKSPGHTVALIGVGDTLEETKRVWQSIVGNIRDGVVVSAWAVTEGGALEGLLKMSLGNELGVDIDPDISPEALIKSPPGTILAELTSPLTGLAAQYAVTVGVTTDAPRISRGNEAVTISELGEKWEQTLEGVFPTRTADTGSVPAVSCEARPGIVSGAKFSSPRGVIFSFPGTNSELDTARALERAGGTAEVVVIKNLTPRLLSQSIDEAAAAIAKSQIIIIPGGFSGGDEPDGSAKFIAAFFRAPALYDAISAHLTQRDGLILGICNGFQALIKLGLVPYGSLAPQTRESPTLTYNVIGRHQARYVNTRVASVRSPWMSLSNVGDVYAVPISHGEGRFVASEAEFNRLAASGQIATQYADAAGCPSMDVRFNPNGSLHAVEGIFSPDGRVFGKMGHSERRGEYVAKNIFGDKHQPVFESGVAYYK